MPRSSRYDPHEVELYFGGRKLPSDEASLSECKIYEGCVVQASSTRRVRLVSSSDL